jgi:nucleoside-diphosphate-sugar epimerase
MSRIVITGATGFLGYRTAVALSAQGHEVTGLGRNISMGRLLEQSGIPFVRCELSDATKLRSVFKGHEIVIHCAALTRHGAPADEYRVTNIIGSRNVMQAMARTSVRRWIHLSTARLYGGGGDRTGVRESDEFGPKTNDPFIESKRQIEIDIDNFVLVPSIIFRPQVIFGPGDTHLLPYLARFARWNKLPRFDLGETLFDPVYVDNVVDLISAAVQAPEDRTGKAYNVSNASPVENYAFLTALAETTGRSVKPWDARGSRALTLAGMLESLYQTFFPGSEAPLTKNMVRLLTESISLNVSASKEYLAYHPRVSLREAINTMGKIRPRRR